MKINMFGLYRNVVPRWKIDGLKGVIKYYEMYRKEISQQ